MTPDERKLLTDLFDRIRDASANPRDREAEALIADSVRAQPYAPYFLAQAVIVQEEALKAAAARIETLEREAQQARTEPAGGGSFLGGLGSIFGGGQRAPEPPPGGPWGSQRGSVPPAGQQRGNDQAPPQGGGWAGQGNQQQQPMGQMGQGGGFLKGALGTAAGVAGGVMLANSLQGLFSGHNNTHGIAGGLGGQGNASSGADSASLAKHDDSAITGGVFDRSQADQDAADDREADAADWADNSGGDDDSYDA